MKTALQKLRRVLNTKLGFFLLVVLLFCLKSYWAYQNEFNLGVKGKTYKAYFYNLSINFYVCYKLELIGYD